MRVAVVHSFYSSTQPSGENFVVESELRALRRAGHEVECFAAHTDHLAGDLLYPVRAALRVATGRGAHPLNAIRRFSPDLVHVHNLFPNWGRHWVLDLDVPLLHTVHNFRAVCANGLLFRDNRICTDCVDGSHWASVRHGCYRNSRISTLPVAWALRNGPSRDPLIKRADRLLVLTERQGQVLLQAGVPEEKLTLFPNFIPADLDPGAPPDTRRSGSLFVGRLSAEKGILDLLRGWPDGEPLSIIGDGPQRPEVEAAIAGRREISFLGRQPRTIVIQAMRHHRRLVFPSRCFEGFPLVYAEALACGLPVLAFRPSSVADIAQQDGTGLAVSWDEPWERAVASPDDPTPRACRNVFDALYSERSYQRRIESLANSLMASA